MVAIPSILTNKTVLTGLSQSALKASSLFKAAPLAAERMGKVVAAAPAVGIDKITSFTADIGAKKTLGPANLSTPFFVSTKMVR